MELNQSKKLKMKVSENPLVLTKLKIQIICGIYRGLHTLYVISVGEIDNMRLSRTRLLE